MVLATLLDKTFAQYSPMVVYRKEISHNLNHLGSVKYLIETQIRKLDRWDEIDTSDARPRR